MCGGAIIRAEGLAKHFGHTQALRGVDLTVRAGEFWSIFGPNGAGKTTLIGILATLLRPTAGRLTIDGITLGEDDAEIRRRIGVVSHQTFLYGDLTAYENLAFYGRLYGVDGIKERITRMIDDAGLGDWAYERVRNLSRGMQQRLAIARSLLHDPSILLLDEPHTGLDQHALKHFQKLLRSLHTEERTILMATHNLALGLEGCSHVAVLVGGRIVYSASRADLGEADFEEIYFRCVERGGR
ncbi:MAG: ABC transporter ATP-binding protein [bacterium]